MILHTKEVSRYEKDASLQCRIKNTYDQIKAYFQADELKGGSLTIFAVVINIELTPTSDSSK